MKIKTQTLLHCFDNFGSSFASMKHLVFFIHIVTRSDFWFRFGFMQILFKKLIIIWLFVLNLKVNNRFGITIPINFFFYSILFILINLSLFQQIYHCEHWQIYYCSNKKTSTSLSLSFFFPNSIKQSTIKKLKIYLNWKLKHIHYYIVLITVKFFKLF